MTTTVEFKKEIALFLIFINSHLPLFQEEE